MRQKRQNRLHSHPRGHKRKAGQKSSTTITKIPRMGKGGQERKKAKIRWASKVMMAVTEELKPWEPKRELGAGGKECEGNWPLEKQTLREPPSTLTT